MQIERSIRKICKVSRKVENAIGDVGDGIDDDQAVAVENSARAERLPDSIRRRAHLQKHLLQKVYAKPQSKQPRRIAPDDCRLCFCRRPEPRLHQFGKAAGAHLLGVVGKIKGAPRIFLRAAMRLLLHVRRIADAI